MNRRRWEFAILVSDEGFGGIQILDSSPEVRYGVMAVLPELRGAFKNLDETIKKIGREGHDET